MHRYKNKILLVLLFIIIFSLKTKAQNDEKSKIDAFYYKAVEKKNIGEINDAIALLKYNLLMNDSIASTNYEMAMLSKDRESFEYLEKAYNLNKEDEDYNIAYANALMQNNDFDKALDVLKKAHEKYPNKESWLQYLAIAYSYLGMSNEAIDVYDKLQSLNKNKSFYKEIANNKLKLYQNTNDFERMEKELKKLITLFPEDYAYTEYLLNLYLSLYKEDNDRNLNKNKLISTARSIDINDNNIEFALFYNIYADILEASFATKNMKDLQKFINIKDIDKSKKVDLLDDISNELINKNDSKSLLKLIVFYKQLADEYISDSLDNLVVSLVSDFTKKLIENNYAKDAEKMLSAIAKRSTLKTFIYSEFCNFFLDEKYMKELSIISQQAIKDSADNALFYIWASSYYLNDKNNKSKKHNYKKGISIVKDGIDKAKTGPKALLYIVLADEYSKDLKNHYLAIENYEKAIKEDPNDAYAANNYAYFLSEKTKNIDLDKAESLAAKAVEINKNDYNSRDTYAWIFYKKKNYSLARLHIAKAIEQMKNSEDTLSGVILFHAAKIYEANEDIETAINYYKDAIEHLDEDKNKDERDETLTALDRLTNN